MKNYLDHELCEYSLVRYTKQTSYKRFICNKCGVCLYQDINHGRLNNVFYISQYSLIKNKQLWLHTSCNELIIKSIIE